MSRLIEFALACPAASIPAKQIMLSVVLIILLVFIIVSSVFLSDLDGLVLGFLLYGLVFCNRRLFSPGVEFKRSKSMLQMPRHQPRFQTNVVLTQQRIIK